MMCCNMHVNGKSAKSNVLDAGDGKAWYSLFVSGLDKIKLFQKYGTVVWGFVSIDFGRRERVQCSGLLQCEQIYTDN